MPSLRVTSDESARATKRRSVSIITLPTRWILRRSTPSETRFLSASGPVVNSRSDNASVTIRLTSSGIDRSRDRSPASTWATLMGGDIFAATIEQAIVELTSPTTTTQSG